MNSDTIFGIYVYCAHHHSGQWSRLYRLMCRCQVSNLSDRAEKQIANGGEWKRIPASKPNRKRYRWAPTQEWESAHEVYRSLKARKAK